MKTKTSSKGGSASPAMLRIAGLAGGKKARRGVQSFKLVRSKDLNLEQIIRSLKIVQRSITKLSKQIARQPAIKFLEKQRNLLAVVSLTVALALALLPWSTNGQEMTFSQANQKFVSDYLTFLGNSYGEMVNDTLMAWAKTVYQLSNFKIALKETVQAYSAMLQPAGKLLTKAFNSTGEVLAVVSYALATPARVMAMTAR